LKKKAHNNKKEEVFKFFKEHSNESLSEISRLTGISRPTLTKYKKEFDTKEIEILKEKQLEKEENYIPLKNKDWYLEEEFFETENWKLIYGDRLFLTDEFNFFVSEDSQNSYYENTKDFNRSKKITGEVIEDFGCPTSEKILLFLNTNDLEDTILDNLNHKFLGQEFYVVLYAVGKKKSGRLYWEEKYARFFYDNLEI